MVHGFSILRRSLYYKAAFPKFFLVLSVYFYVFSYLKLRKGHLVNTIVPNLV